MPSCYATTAYVLGSIPNFLISLSLVSCHWFFLGKSTRIPLEVRLFTRMPLKVPKLPNYPYVKKNTLYKVIIHSNVQALFTRIPFKHKFLSLSLSLSLRRRRLSSSSSSSSASASVSSSSSSATGPFCLSDGCFASYALIRSIKETSIYCNVRCNF